MVVKSTLAPENVVVLSKVIPPPAAGAAHFKPVASALSATMLKLGIVLGTIADDCA